MSSTATNRYSGYPWGVLTLLLVCSASLSQAQNKVILVGRVQKDRILLRWIPSSPICWKYANKYGYMIERITVTRDGAILINPEHKFLNDKALIPAAYELWKPLTDTSNYAAVLAQAIYGDSFNVLAGNRMDKNTKISLL